MTTWKAWFDVRRRFGIGLAVAGVAALLTAMAWAYLDQLLPLVELTPDDTREIARATHDYRTWVSATWVNASGGGLVAYLGVLLALGGILTEKRAGTLEVTLSLPVTRVRWVLTHAGVAVALIAVIALLSTALLAVGGAVMGARYAIADAMRDALRIAIVASSAIGITFAVAAFTGDNVKTAVLAIATVFLIHQLPGGFAVPFWGFPVIGLIGLASAIVVFARTDA